MTEQPITNKPEKYRAEIKNADGSVDVYETDGINKPTKNGVPFDAYPEQEFKPYNYPRELRWSNPITNTPSNDKYLPLYILVSKAGGEPTIEQLREIEDMVNDNWGKSLDIYANREKILTIGYSEPIYNFIKQCAGMREIDGIEYYNVFGQWQKIIQHENNY